MSMVKLFVAAKNGVFCGVFCGRELVRGGLTEGQAKIFAQRLNSLSEDMGRGCKPTRREQKFSIHAELDLEITSMRDAEEFEDFYRVSEIKTALRQELENIEPVGGVYGTPKTKIVVTTVYDKQVPND